MHKIGHIVVMYETSCILVPCYCSALETCSTHSEIGFTNPEDGSVITVSQFSSKRTCQMFPLSCMISVEYPLSLDCSLWTLQLTKVSEISLQDINKWLCLQTAVDGAACKTSAYPGAGVCVPLPQCVLRVFRQDLDIYLKKYFCTHDR